MNTDEEIAELRVAMQGDPDPDIAGRLFKALEKRPELLTRADVELLAVRLRDHAVTQAIVMSQGFSVDYKLGGLYRLRPDLFTADEGAMLAPHWSLLVGKQALAAIGLAGGAAFGVQTWGLSEPHPGLVLSVAVGVGLAMLPWFVIEPRIHHWAHRQALDRAGQRPAR